MPAQDQPVYETREWQVDLARRELRLRGIPLPLGDRAFDIIQILVQAAGDLVTKDVLMARVWPGAVVEENTLQVHISALRKALGPGRTMLKTVPGRGYRLLGDWTTHRKDATRGAMMPDPVDTPARPSLAAVSNLIGREGIVRRLRELLSTSRLVTLTGPGGIGKTVLALEVARALLSEFQGEVFPVELASLADPSLVPSAVAAALDLKLGTGISAESIARVIGERKLLVVLDNCEHVIDAAARLSETVARRCSRVSILATSREVLRTEGECVYRVPPLDVPPLHRSEPNHVLGHSAVQLFVARAAALHADFSQREESLSTIAAICRRLDGIPLAIEFAAACAAALGPAQVEAGLDDRFSLLTQGRRTALPRQQTLRATLDWSYELLPEAERRLLRRLAIFPAGFALDAAIAVQGKIVGGATVVVDGLANLVAKSLVTSDRAGLARRWRLLETIRAYALEKLIESGEAADAARCHAEFFRTLLTSAASGVEDIRRHARELDNIRAALDWGLSSAGDPDLAVNLTVAAVPLWTRVSLVEECRERVEHALASLTARPDRRPRHEMELLAAWGAALLLTRGAAPEMHAAWSKALEIAERLGDTEYRLRALWGLYVHHFTRGDHRAALACAERYARFAASAAPADQLIGERMIGTALHILGNQVEARRLVERVLEHFVAPKNRPRPTRFVFDQGVSARSFYGRILWLQGLADQALDVVTRTVAEAQHLDDPVSLFYALAEAACPIALLAGHLDKARNFAAMVLELSAKHAMDTWNAWGRCLRGSLRIRGGAILPGLRLLQSGLADLHEAGLHFHYTTFLADLALALGRTGQTAAGRATIDDALARCQRNEEGWCLAELLRLKGELVLMAGAAGAIAAADELFQRALDRARQQQASSWELRTAVSLARLRIRQRRPDDAALILVPVYDKFTEGFGTADLSAAKAVLASLTGS